MRNGSLLENMGRSVLAVSLALLCACGSSDKKEEAPPPPTAGKDGIRKVIAGHAAEIQKCYTSELRNTPEL
ncbi:MAG: hypothetical protein ABL958_15040, partial [Bdellovibrionia bacterium]